jgi:serine/threonine protein kinase
MVFGLAAMAQKKVIHRDFKLANILIHFPELRRVDYTDANFNLKNFVKDVVVEGSEELNYGAKKTEMEIKIADMGFAKKLEENQLASTSLGTPLNMAPEVLFHRKYDEKADVWSLGCVFYEMLTGFTPFTGMSKQNLAQNV